MEILLRLAAPQCGKACLTENMINLSAGYACSFRRSLEIFFKRVLGKASLSALGSGTAPLLPESAGGQCFTAGVTESGVGVFLHRAA